MIDEPQIDSFFPAADKRCCAHISIKSEPAFLCHAFNPLCQAVRTLYTVSEKVSFYFCL